MIRLTLAHQAGYAWRTLEGPAGRLHVKGNTWELDGPLGAWQRDTPGDLEALTGVVRALTGSFALVFEGAGLLYAAADAIRGQPLFYRWDGSELHLTDDPYAPALALPRAPDAPLPLAEFQLAGYAGLDETLNERLKAVAAGTHLIARTVDGKTAFRVHAHHPSIRAPAHPDQRPEALSRLLLEAADEVFADLCAGLGDRQAVIPLSSGFDSRFIAAMLKRHGHDRVLTFTYGRPGNWEQDTSRQTAERLGFPWHFVPYGRERWRRWYGSADMARYLPFAGRHAATPHVQDWPAVAHLKERGLVSADAVFLPGHTCVLISNRLERDLADLPPAQWRARLARSLFEHHFILQRPGRVIPDVAPLLARIERALPEDLEGDRHRLLNAYFDFEAKERHGKMLVNSARVYEFWGHPWSAPLWDARLIAVWAGVDYDGRYAKRAFKDLLFGENFYGLFPRPAGPGAYQRLRQRVKDTPWLFRPLKRVKCAEHRLLGYFHDWRDWYGIVGWADYVRHMGRCGDMYSLLSRLYLEALREPAPGRAVPSVPGEQVSGAAPEPPDPGTPSPPGRGPG